MIEIIKNIHNKNNRKPLSVVIKKNSYIEFLRLPKYTFSQIGYIIDNIKLIYCYIDNKS